MSRPVETVIDGYKVATAKHPPLPGVVLKARVVAVVAPVMRAVAASGVGSFEEFEGMELNAETIGKVAPVIEAVARAIKPEDLPALIAELLSNSTIEIPNATTNQPNRIPLGTQDMINFAFDDRDATMYKVIAFAAGVNFGDFFGGKGSASASPSTVTASP